MMIRKIRNKFHSKSGETITEVLVAALVVVLGSILLATMVSAAFRMIRRSEKSYDQYLATQDALAKKQPDVPVSAKTGAEADEQATYTAGSGTVEISGAISTSIGVTTDTVSIDGKETVYSYSYSTEAASTAQ